MKKIIILIVLSLIFTSSTIYSQEKEIPKQTLQKIEKCFVEKGEIYFKFKIFLLSEIETLTRIISIANVDGNDVYAYANKKEFEKFKKLGYTFELLQHPSDEATDIVMAEDAGKVISSWSYPTYNQYITMMNNFAATYPDLCKIVNAGTTVQGRKILFAVISKNVNTAEAEPKFLYTSTMHGNETAGYVFMLHLIDTLLSGYSTNPDFSNLLDNMEIWINPLANPDGTYHGGNNTVTKATRGNANNVDLNRNYPNQIMGDHPDGYAWQKETIIFKNLADNNYFTMSANFHSGVEVINYPWDCKMTPVTADDNWWVLVSRQYADLAHNVNKNYMKYMNNGITYGASWYIAYGTRQDYMTYYKNGRECTVELNGGSYILAVNKLSQYYNYNFKSLIAYMNQALYGLTGTVKEANTNKPVNAMIKILNHDLDNSEVYSDAQSGEYYRPLYAGTYSVTASADGYNSLTKTVTINNNSLTSLNFDLTKAKNRITGVVLNNKAGVPDKFDLSQNYPNPFNPTTKIRFEIPSDIKSQTQDGYFPLRRGVGGMTTLKIFDIAGREVSTLVNENLNPGTYEVTFDATNYSSGIYFYKLVSGGFMETKKMILLK